ncbi:unnamed protein product [Spirodela intermedia]|uniref:Uncharacterized protein n=1 Tax=Spirodela intermedia TaxID=51605 RepID=A0A7I8JUS7_SPIIN|nr:unnamed protein product [Spirodela intermedia]CAA6673859.1 unnamed protein product [Spirodela intermedia]
MKSDTTPTNWMLVVSAALLSTLAVRLRCRLRQAFGGDSSGISEERRADIKAVQARPSWSESTDTELPLVAAPAAERVKDRDGGGGGGGSSDSDSPRVGVGFRRRAPAGEVQKKLREQLRRRDEMISEMQAQVAAAAAPSPARKPARPTCAPSSTAPARAWPTDLKLLTNGWARVPSYGKLRNK